MTFPTFDLDPFGFLIKKATKPDQEPTLEG